MENVENKKVLCHMCGKEMLSKDGILHEDGLFVTKEWGYFSHKDLKIHRFNLCETCYDHLVERFIVPIEEEDKRIALE